MTPYEIYSFMAGRDQPTFDRQIVNTASSATLDEKLVPTYLDRIQHTRNNIWNRLRLGEKDSIGQLVALDVMATEDGVAHPTLAGLLVFGTDRKNLTHR